MATASCRETRAEKTKQSPPNSTCYPETTDALPRFSECKPDRRDRLPGTNDGRGRIQSCVESDCDPIELHSSNCPKLCEPVPYRSGRNSGMKTTTRLPGKRPVREPAR